MILFLFLQDCEPFEKCCPNVCWTQELCGCPLQWTLRAGKVQWGCPKGSPVTNSCAHSRVQSVKSGTDSRCASAGTVVDGNPISHAPRMAWLTTTSATWMPRPVPGASPSSKSPAGTTLACPTPVLFQRRPPLGPPPAHLETTPMDIQRPIMVSNPAHHFVFVGETASFLCEVTGKTEAGDYMGKADRR